ncbi:MAG TPA: hypothetical protein PK530_01190, partial [Anaerolineales bacterium]|nr:hypothetical protein [Anaerolineales bacterium]
MTDAEQELNDRLERLQAGETLDDVLSGLEEDESDLVQFAAQIIAIPKPVRDTAIVRAQYQSVMRATQSTASKQSHSFNWPTSFKWMVLASVFLLVIATVTGFYAGMNWLSSPAKPIPQEVAVHETQPTSETNPPVLAETPANEVVQPPLSTSQPQNALLFSVHGIVQVQNDDG